MSVHVQLTDTVGSMLSRHLTSEEAERLCGLIQSRVRETDSKEPSDHELLKKAVEVIGTMAKSLSDLSRRLERVEQYIAAQILEPDTEKESAVQAQTWTYHGLHTIKPNQPEDEPDIVYPRKPCSQGEGTIVELRSHLVFDSAEARDYSFWLNALDYCMAVAREFEKKEWSRRNPEAIPKYSLGSGWKSGLVLGGTPQLFRFCTLKDCDLFIRSVGQGRLNLIFGVKL